MQNYSKSGIHLIPVGTHQSPLQHRIYFPEERHGHGPLSNILSACYIKVFRKSKKWQHCTHLPKYKKPGRGSAAEHLPQTTTMNNMLPTKAPEINLKRHSAVKQGLEMSRREICCDRGRSCAAWEQISDPGSLI